MFRLFFKLKNTPSSSFSTLKLDFRSSTPIFIDSSKSDTLDFALDYIDPSKNAKRVRFSLKKEETVKDLFGKISSIFDAKKLVALSLKKEEISETNTLAHLQNQIFYIADTSGGLFKIVSAEKVIEEPEIKNYCKLVDLGILETNVITNYLSRLEKINKEKGFVVLHDKNRGAFVDKDEILRNLIEAIPNFKNQGLSRFEELSAEREGLLRKLFELREKKAELEAKALKAANRKMYLGLGFLFGHFTFVGYGTYVIYSWDIIEPLVYFIGLFTSLVLGVQFFKTRDQFSYKGYLGWLKRREFERICKASKFSIAAFELEEKKLEKIEELIKSHIYLNL